MLVIVVVLIVEGGREEEGEFVRENGGEVGVEEFAVVVDEQVSFPCDDPAVADDFQYRDDFALGEVHFRGAFRHKLVHRDIQILVLGGQSTQCLFAPISIFSQLRCLLLLLLDHPV